MIKEHTKYFQMKTFWGRLLPKRGILWSLRVKFKSKERKNMSLETANKKIHMIKLFLTICFIESMELFLSTHIEIDLIVYNSPYIHCGFIELFIGNFGAQKL